MKKVYGKPMISFENFAFSNNIAGGCGDANATLFTNGSCLSYGTYNDPDTCAFFDNGFSIFYGNQCMSKPQDTNDDNTCYHVSSNGGGALAS